MGGFLSAVTGGGWTSTWALGMFDRVIGLGPAGKLAWMFAGGLCIGFGTRLGGACTSGHGIFCLSNFKMPSLVTTVSFMAGASSSPASCTGSSSIDGAPMTLVYLVLGTVFWFVLQSVGRGRL